MWKFIIILTSVLLFGSCNQPETTPETTPESVNNNINSLKAGNSRFFMNEPLNWEPLSPSENKEMAKNSIEPSTIILSCSDMVILPAIILDQKIESLYQIRTVGNFIGKYEMGSIEYALQKFECKTLLILGHKNCGAISYFVETLDQRKKGEIISNFDHIDTLINYFSGEETFDKLSPQDKMNVSNIVEKNIYYQANFLKKRDGQIKKLIDHHQVKIYGGVFDPQTRKIDFFDL